MVDEDRDLGREHLRLGDLDGSVGDRLFARIVENPIDRAPGSLKQRFGRMELHFEIADLRDGEDVFVAMLLAAIDPGPRMAAHETDRLLDCAPRNARVHRRLDDLRDRPV